MNLSLVIKDQLGLKQVAEQFNIGAINANGRGDCPFCYGSKSLKTTRDQYFRCFKCDASGSVFDLLIHSGQAKSFSEALSLLRPLIDHTYIKQSSRRSILDKLWHDLQSIDSPEVINWLRSRGIPVESVPREFLNDFAYWSTDFTNLIHNRYSAKDLEDLTEYGLYPPQRFEGRVLIPIRNLSGDIVHFTGRSIDREVELRWLHTKGQPPINNYLYQLNQVFKQSQDYLILCEGVTDCLSLRTLGEPAVACFGVNLSLTQHAWAIKDRISHLVVILDRDKYSLGTPLAGKYKSWTGMMPNLIDLAVELKIPIFCCMVPNWSGVKDVNDFLKEIDFDLTEFKRYLANTAVDLEELAFNLYLEHPEDHDKLWLLLKHLNKPSATAKLRTYVEARYPSWTDYLFDRLPITQ